MIWNDLEIGINRKQLALSHYMTMSPLLNALSQLQTDLGEKPRGLKSTHKELLCGA